MSLRLRTVLLTALAGFAVASYAQTSPTRSTQPDLPDGPGKDTTLRLCGTCHSAKIILGHTLTRQQWSDVVASMISRGAKGSQAEFTEVTDYLARSFPPASAASAAAPVRRRGGFTVGPADEQVVDPSEAAHGKALYEPQCESCHGPKARGTANGPDLVRSVVLLHDRYGSTLGPFLAGGHPKSKPVNLTQSQVQALSHFLHQQLGDTLRSGPYNEVLNVLTGNAKAGADYFNGVGGCTKCHSASGDLAHIASRYEPPVLQQRLLFPQTPVLSAGASKIQAVEVTVTAPGQKPVSGALDKIDDFDVSLHDASGQYHSWKRTTDLKVEKHDPYAAHYELLDRYTDQDIHNLVAYLETLK